MATCVYTCYIAGCVPQDLDKPCISYTYIPRTPTHSVELQCSLHIYYNNGGYILGQGGSCSWFPHRALPLHIVLTYTSAPKMFHRICQKFPAHENKNHYLSVSVSVSVLPRFHTNRLPPWSTQARRPDEPGANPTSNTGPVNPLRRARLLVWRWMTRRT